MLALMLSVMEIILALKSTPLFRNVPGEGLKRLSDFIQEKNVSAEDVVFHEEELGDEMYFVRTGQVSLHHQLPSGPALIEMVEPGGYFGEMALIDDMPRTATATAEVDSSLLVLHQNDFRSAVQDYPDIAFEIFREFTRRLRRSDQRYRELLEEARRLGLEAR